MLVGGLVGTGLRLGIDALLPHADDAFPWSTLLINVVGSFALGVLVARVWPTAPAWLRAGLGAGLLGSFTTFSAVAVSLVALADAGEWATARRLPGRDAGGRARRGVGGRRACSGGAARRSRRPEVDE